MAITLLKPFNLDTAGNYTFNTLTANIKTDNLMYANGSPYIFSSNAAGSNTQIQFNNANSFGASAAFTFDTSSNVLNVTGNITTNNANLGNLAVANYLTGTLTTGTQSNITSVGTLTSLTVSGMITATGTGIKTANIYDSTSTLTIETKYGNAAGDAGIYGNLTVGTSGTGNITAYNANLGNLVIGNYLQGTLVTGSQPNITSVGTLSSLTVLGNITSANANLGNSVIANYFIGNGSLLTGLPEQYANSNVANYLPTYTGNFSAGNITVTSNSTLGNLAVANYFSGNGSLLSSITAGNVTGQVGNALVAGTVYTNTQPNITSVGTLSNLAVTANISAGNILTNNLLYANGAAWDLSGTYSNANVANYLPTYTGNVGANYFIGNGSALSSIAGGNVTGQVTNAFIAGTVYTNAQPNITSIGTLTSLTVSGTTTSGNVYANTGSVVASTLTGSLTTASQPNITNLGSLLGLTVTGNVDIAGSNVSLGTVANLKILGGTANYVLKTDGAGNLNWVAQPNAANITVDNFTGNGVQTTFTLTTTPSNVNSVLVNINGASQLREAFTLSGANLTFVSAPPNTAKIEITTLGLTASAGGGNSLATLTDVSLSSPTNGQALKYNGSVWINDTIAAYTYQAISANTTLSAGYRYLVDTSAANLTLTLPNSPSLGQEVGIIDATGTAATHEITVNGNGANIMGNSSSMIVNTSNSAFVLVYYNSGRGWILTNV